MRVGEEALTSTGIDGRDTLNSKVNCNILFFLHRDLAVAATGLHLFSKRVPRRVLDGTRTTPSPLPWASGWQLAEILRGRCGSPAFTQGDSSSPHPVGPTLISLAPGPIL